MKRCKNVLENSKCRLLLKREVGNLEINSICIDDNLFFTKNQRKQIVNSKPEITIWFQIKS